MKLMNVKNLKYCIRVASKGLLFYQQTPINLSKIREILSMSKTCLHTGTGFVRKHELIGDGREFGMHFKNIFTLFFVEAFKLSSKDL